MNRIAGRARITVVLALLLLVGLGFFLAEYVMQAAQWVVFPGSPHVYTGTNIGCGVVVDTDGVLLLDLEDGRTYCDDENLRKATVHWVGDRHGSVSASALSYYSTELAGYDLLNGTYTYGGQSGVATMTLSANVQTAALEAMAGKKGTVAVYNYKTGELLCAVTTPTFDPDHVPESEGDSEELEGLYFNRFTQATYIPGSIYKIVTLAAALETDPAILEETFVCTGSYAFGEDEITCEGIHFDQDVKTAFCNSCNCVFAQIVERLGAQTLRQYVEQFGINESVIFDGITTAKGNFEADDVMDANVAWSGIGQHKDQVNPCAFLTFMGAVASDGKGVTPHLVERITVGSATTYRAKTMQAERIMSVSTAKTLQEFLRYNVENKYGTYNFPELTVCAKTGTGEVGGEKKPNAMFTGFVTDEKYPLAFIVCVEDGGYGSTVCIPIASRVLAQCKASMDGSIG